MTQYSQLLQNLEKAITAGDITAVVPEDLEIEAHNTLWDLTDPTELTLLKLCPSVGATSVRHEYTRITSFGSQRDSGHFTETGLPARTGFGSSRQEVNIKLIGVMGPTYLLASLEKTQKALGTQGAANIQRAALQRNLLHKKCRSMYFSDTRNSKGGDDGLIPAGLIQQIEQGTDGTVGARSPWGSHVIDMQEQPLTVDTLRDKVSQGIIVHGAMNSLLMDPFARGDFEGSLDAAERLELPIGARAFMVGQNVGGLQTQNGQIWFETDNTLSAMHSRPQYRTDDTHDQTPTSTPTVTATAQAVSGSNVSEWDASSAGNVYYVVTEVVNEMEGLGTRAPASGTVAVAAGQEVALSITAGNFQADRFRVYRGTDSDTADTDAWFVFEVANGVSPGAVAAFDLNEWRPNTSVAFGLRVSSWATRAMRGGERTGYYAAQAMSASMVGTQDSPDSTVACVTLGPKMGVMQIAPIAPTVDNPLLYSAYAMEVRNPRQNFVFKNIGRQT
ncbi:MAG: hypothetical protein ACPGVG_18240 [Mycobacterium sp.]